jgi:hypothetical protein
MVGWFGTVIAERGRLHKPSTLVPLGQPVHLSEVMFFAVFFGTLSTRAGLRSAPAGEGDNSSRISARPSAENFGRPPVR